MRELKILSVGCKDGPWSPRRGGRGAEEDPAESGFRQSQTVERDALGRGAS